MNSILGTLAICLVTITLGATPAGAQDINIYVYGEDGTTFGPSAHGEGHRRHMRGQGKHHRDGHGMHRGHGQHGQGRGSDDGEASTHRGYWLLTLGFFVGLAKWK